MTAINKSGASFGDLAWSNLEWGAKLLRTPKPYFKMGESVFRWGAYVLPSVAPQCEAIASAVKTAISPVAIADAVSSGCKLRTYVIQTQASQDQRFGEIFAKGVMHVGGFAENVCKSVSFLNRMNFLTLANAMAFRINLIGGICSLAKSSIELVIQSRDLIPLIINGDDIESNQRVEYVKSVLGAIFSILSLCAIYQPTPVGAFLMLLVGSGLNLADVFV